jgi:hypothetical protein
VEEPPGGDATVARGETRPIGHAIFFRKIFQNFPEPEFQMGVRPRRLDDEGRYPSVGTHGREPQERDSGAPMAHATTAGSAAPPRTKLSKE